MWIYAEIGKSSKLLFYLDLFDALRKKPLGKEKRFSSQLRVFMFLAFFVFIYCRSNIRKRDRESFYGQVTAKLSLLAEASLRLKSKTRIQSMVPTWVAETKVHEPWWSSLAKAAVKSWSHSLTLDSPAWGMSILNPRPNFCPHILIFIHKHSLGAKPKKTYIKIKNK